MTTAEVSAPTRIATCCVHGVAPTRKPVLRSCEVVPPFETAMQTIPAIESAARRYSGPTQPSRTKIRQVSSSVATVIPEIGFDDEPISPVSREETVTNRNPKSDDHRRRRRPGPVSVGRDQVRRGDRRHQPERAEADDPERQVALGPAGCRRRRPLARAQVAEAAGRASRRSAAGPGAG